MEKILKFESGDFVHSVLLKLSIFVTTMHYFYIQDKNIKTFPVWGKRCQGGLSFFPSGGPEAGQHMYLGMAGCPEPLISVALGEAASVYPLAWPLTHSHLACSILSVYRPGLHFLLIQTTWHPCCGVSRQKREPQPPSGCQGGWQEGASPPGVSWETASSPEKGHLEIKFLPPPPCVCMCAGAGEGAKKPHQPPLLSSLQGKPLPAALRTPSPHSSPFPRNRVGSAAPPCPVALVHQTLS